MQTKTISLQDKGAFNAGLAALENENYLLVYRNTETTFKGVMLNEHLNPYKDSYATLPYTDVADPRLIWVNYCHSATFCKQINGLETIWISNVHYGSWTGCEAMFRVSPDNGERQKNWMPFTSGRGDCGDRLFFVGSVNPLQVYEYDIFKKAIIGEWKHDWQPNWFIDTRLRGSTNAVKLPDGNILATFHSVEKIADLWHYDNGAFIFEGQPPFNIIRSATIPFLPAEAACSEPFRKGGVMKCCFPVGMVRKANGELLISYGDSDSEVKILTATVDELMQPDETRWQKIYAERRQAIPNIVTVEVLTPFLYGNRNMIPDGQDGIWGMAVSMPRADAEVFAQRGKVKIVTK